MPSKQFIKSVYQFIRLSFSSIVICALLSSCASTPATKAQISATPTTQKLIPYNKVSRMQEPKKSFSALVNAALATRRAQYTLAENYLLLATLSSSNANTHPQALTIAALLVPYTDHLAALTEWFSANTTTNTPIALVEQFDFSVAVRNKNYQIAAALGLPLSNNDRLDDNFLRQLWLSLQALTAPEITTLLNQQITGSPAISWASFTAAYLSNGSSLQQQAGKISAWQSQWPQHSANRIASTDINTVQHLANTMAQTAVVAIPLSGRLSNAGKAIQAAMIAAHLDRPQFAKLLFIDSASYPSANDLLSDIKTHSPDVIIGPINKDKARDLAQNIRRTTPLIALNTFDTTLTNGANTPSYQLSLNIEDEAEFLAKASPENFTHALVISTPNPLAHRAATAFTTRWNNREEAQLVAAPLASASEFSKAIERYFLITDSQARQTSLENIFIEKMESNPRRRKDIDVIFMSATANEARAINPLLAYHYAGDLPVLSPSIVFDGRYDSVSNRDLTGIVFSDTPWAISPANLKSSMHYHTQNGGAPSKNLHALGIDAYYFAARIKLWRKGQHQSFSGLSGQRLIEPNGTTTRVPALARITRRGIIPQAAINE